eukprot:8718709-Pyramimonas_sp.AAC.2
MISTYLASPGTASGAVSRVLSDSPSPTARVALLWASPSLVSLAFCFVSESCARCGRGEWD